MAPRWRYLLPAPVRNLPADLAATIALTGLTVLVVVLPGLRETPLRILLGLPFVLFLPGYAFIAMLFPEAGSGPTAASPAAESSDPRTPTTTPAADQEAAAADAASRSPSRDGGIDGIERVALSFGLSIAIVPLIGLVLNFTPFGIRLAPILVSVSAVTVLCAIGAAYRRWDLPPEDRFTVPYRDWWAAARAELLAPEDRTDAALNVLLVVSVLLAVGSVAYAVAVPPQGEAFTEFYLLTETDDGELVAAEYPEELTAGANTTLTVGVGNNEHQPMDYTVVVQQQRVEVINNSTRVRERAELARYQTAVAANETWHHQHTIQPTFTGDRLRLQYLLYRGAPPATPTNATAYRELHLWVNVTER